jgi:hypothetical protein
VASCVLEGPSAGGDGLRELDHAHLAATGRAGRLERWIEACRRAAA